MATRVIATLVLIAWLSQIGLIILPLKNDSVSTAASGLQDFAEKNQAALKWMKEKSEPRGADPAELKEKAKQELWTFWFIQSGIILLGIVAGLAAFFRFGYWRVFVMVTSVLYLILWGFRHKAIVSSVGLIQAYKLSWDMAARFGTVLDFFHRDVLLPIFYLIIVILLAVWRSFYRRDLMRGTKN